MNLRELINRWLRIFKPGSKIKVHRLEGDVCALDLLQVQNTWFEHPDFDELTPVLWDLRAARFTRDEQKALVISRGLIFQSKQHRPDGRACILVSSHEDLEVLRHAFKQNIDTGRMMVTDSESASEQWLLLKPVKHSN